MPTRRSAPTPPDDAAPTAPAPRAKPATPRSPEGDAKPAAAPRPRTPRVVGGAAKAAPAAGSAAPAKLEAAARPAADAKPATTARKAPSKAAVKPVGGASPASAAPRPAARAVPANRATSAATPATPAASAGAPAPRLATAPARLSPVGALPPATIPAVALAAPKGVPLLAIALGASLLLHGAVLSLRFAMPDLGRKSTDLPLEVALVNARTKAKPTKADVLAQANLDGGGNTDADRRAKSPLPVLPKDSTRNEITLATERVESLERQTKELLTQLRSTPVATPTPKPNDAQPTESPTANEMMQRSLEAMRLEAQIAKDMDAYQKRPKRQFVGSRAQEYRFARYVEDWRQKIERVGNLNYPAAARQQKLYGSLILTVGIRADGSVESIAVDKSSGQRILDAAAVKIVQMSAPFAMFPPDIRRDTDILYITRTWTFTKGDELVSR